jgi:hypothetical protein
LDQIKPLHKNILGISSFVIFFVTLTYIFGRKDTLRALSHCVFLGGAKKGVVSRLLRGVFYHCRAVVQVFYHCHAVVQVFITVVQVSIVMLNNKIFSLVFLFLLNFFLRSVATSIKKSIFYVEEGFMEER